MPNQFSEDSRRITYVEDRELYEHLAKIAAKDGTSVGELIRRATAEKYSHGAPGAGEITSVASRFAGSEHTTPPVKASQQKLAKKKPKPRNKKYT